jgi:hypothetical protein
VGRKIRQGENAIYWASVLKWQQKATQHKGSSKVTVKDAHPLTLHTKPEQRFNVLSTMDSDTDDDSMPLYHCCMVMDDPHDDDDDHDEPEPIDVAIPQAAPTNPPSRLPRYLLMLTVVSQPILWRSPRLSMLWMTMKGPTRTTLK